jgi:hypothetical protein
MIRDDCARWFLASKNITLLVPFEDKFEGYIGCLSVQLASNNISVQTQNSCDLSTILGFMSYSEPSQVEVETIRCLPKQRQEIQCGKWQFMCIYLLELPGQSTTDWVDKKPKIFFLTILESRGSRSGCWQVRFLLRPLS